MRNNYPIRMILKHLCISVMLGIIQSDLISRIHFATLVMFYVVNFSQILMLSRSFFPNFGQNYWKKPWRSKILSDLSSTHYFV